MKRKVQKEVSVTFAIAAMVLLSSVALHAADISPNPHQITRIVDAETDSTITGFANNGILRKRGAGTLTLSAPALNNVGEVVVESGSAVLNLNDVPTVPTLPDTLKGHIALWLDASVNVVTDDSGNVIDWFDCREENPTSEATTHTKPFASSRHSWTGVEGGAPTFVASDADIGGPYVDFGPYSATFAAGKWLSLTNTSGSAKGLQAMIEAFVVVAKHPNDSANRGFATIFSGYYDGEPCNPLWCGHPSKLWFSNQNTRADRGSTRFDRNSVWGGWVLVDDSDFHLISTRLPIAQHFDPRDKWNLIGADRSNTSGGMRIAEIIAFPVRISEFDRMRVEEYLWRKWMGSRQASVGVVSVNTNATVTIDTDSDVMGDISGGGDVVKTGSGQLRVPALGFSGTVELREGSVRSDGAAFKVPSVASAGKSFLASAASLVTVSDDAAGVVTKTGQGVMTIASLPADATTLSVQQGTVTLAPSLPRPVPAAAAVSNGGFEDFAPVADYNNVGGGQGTSTAQTSNHWTFDRTGRAAGNAVTLVKNEEGTGTFKLTAMDWIGIGYEGEVSLLLCQGKATTTFTLPASGVYKASFRVAGYGPINANVFDAQVLVDGEHVREFSAINTISFTRYEVELPFLEAGEHTFTISDVQPTQTNRIIFDDLKILPVELRDSAPALVTIENPSFELPMINAASYCYDNNYYSPNKDACTGWTMPANSSLPWVASSLRRRWFNGMGIADFHANGLASNCDEMPDGFLCAQLYNILSMSQTIAFPSAGRYRLRFHLARRQGSEPQDVEVSVGGSVVRRVIVCHDEFRPYDAVFDIAEAGEKTLQFLGKKQAVEKVYYTAGCAFLDAISCERVSDIPSGNLVANGTFESGTNGWAIGGNAKLVSAAASDWNSFAVDQYTHAPLQGAEGVIFNSAAEGALRQNVTFPAPGRYELSFRCQTFVRYPDVLTSVDYFTVSIGDNLLLRRSSLAEGDAERVVTLPFTVSEAGTKQLEFFVRPWTGQDCMANVLIDDVSIVAASKEDRSSAELAEFIPKNLEIVVTESGSENYDRSYLNLDFDGVARVAKVTYKGQKIYGEISHETCPTWVMGRGRLSCIAPGSMIILR